MFEKKPIVSTFFLREHGHSAGKAIYLVNFCFPVCIINKSDSAIVSQQITTGKQICLTLGGLLKKLGNYRCHQFSKGCFSIAFRVQG